VLPGFKSKPAADHEARQDHLLFLSWLCLAQFDFTAMPFPPCFLTKCKVYSECQKCRKTLKSTRGERSHLQQCCFNDFDQGNRLTGQENGAPDTCSSGSKRSHSQCATSVASNVCWGSTICPARPESRRCIAARGHWGTRKHIGAATAKLLQTQCHASLSQRHLVAPVQQSVVGLHSLASSRHSNFQPKIDDCIMHTCL